MWRACAEAGSGKDEVRESAKERPLFQPRPDRCGEGACVGWPVCAGVNYMCGVPIRRSELGEEGARFLSPPGPRGFPGGSAGKECAGNAGDLSSIPGLGRPPGEGNGNPPQSSSVENPMHRGAWRVTIHGVTELDPT